MAYDFIKVCGAQHVATIIHDVCLLSPSFLLILKTIYIIISLHPVRSSSKLIVFDTTSIERSRTSHSPYHEKGRLIECRVSCTTSLAAASRRLTSDSKALSTRFRHGKQHLFL